MSQRASPSADGAAARFLSLLPALLAAQLVLGAWALAAGMPEGRFGGSEIARIALASLAAGTIALARALPAVFLLSWPLLRLRAPRTRFMAVATEWSLLLLVQIALEQFYLAARVPLGAELFGYSWSELHTTAAAGVRTDAAALAGWLLPVVVLWGGLAILARRRQRALRPAVAGGVLLLALAAWLVPLQPSAARWADEDAYTLVLDKPAYFVAENLAWLRRHDALPRAGIAGAVAAPTAAAIDPSAGDGRYPFLHEDRTPDALGPFFNAASHQPPNLVFIIVEGLGRSFSGPDAPHGSFTPFLDSLASRSLYFDNFLASQGRTFAVLPSLFGSLPFGDSGFAELGPGMPPHADLLSVLVQQGYHATFYSGWDADFDNERLYLQRQGVGRIVDIHDFDPKTPRANEWGYADKDLVARVLADAHANDAAPTVTVMQTITMHTPYTFAGQGAYALRLEQRLSELGVPEAERGRYRQFANIYESVLYTDDALRMYFEAVARTPAYANTVYIVTGDHRLPELPMDTRIERYHVPLLVFSPLLKHPQRIRSVSSHLDVAPSLLAFLAHGYGLKRPARATWVGDGLDVEPGFRNVHAIPLKQSKSLLTDFVWGTWFLNRGDLYALSDGLDIEPVADAAARAQVQARFDAYRARNDRFARDRLLSPEGERPRLVPYAAAPQLPSEPPAPVPVVREVSAPAQATASTLQVDAVFANDGVRPTALFVPLVVLVAADGREIAERSGAALRLPAGASGSARIALELSRVPAGRYWLAVIPSDPATGKRVGTGRYRIPLQVGPH